MYSFVSLQTYEESITSPVLTDEKNNIERSEVTFPRSLNRYDVSVEFHSGLISKPVLFSIHSSEDRKKKDGREGKKEGKRKRVLEMKEHSQS